MKLPSRLFCILILLNTLMLSSCVTTNALSRSSEDIVIAYTKAFAAKNIPAMSKLVHDDIQWIYVDLAGNDYRGKGKDNLVEELTGYFSRVNLISSEVISVQAESNWVTIVEQPRWKDKSLIKSQKGISVYYLQANKIKQVWYFPEFNKLTE